MDKIPKTMQAAVYRGLNEVCLETVPVPSIASDEILVRVAVCGVCPTDIKKIQYGTVPPPRIFGHETSGEIVRVGARVRGWRTGDRVALHHHVPCLNCQACRHRAFAQCTQYKRTGVTAGFEPAGGGFAEYVRVMPFVFPGIIQIPVANTFVEGALLEPVNTVLKAVRRLGLLAGDAVLVAGQGPIGLMFTGVLALQKAKVVVTDLFPERLRYAAEFGARHLLQVTNEVWVQKVLDLVGSQGLQAVIVTVPIDAVVQEGMTLVNPGGKVLIFAHTTRGSEAKIDLSSVCVDEKDIVGSYSADLTLQEEVTKMVFERKLDVRSLVTHRFPLAEAAQAIELASRPNPNSLKVVVGTGV